MQSRIPRMQCYFFRSYNSDLLVMLPNIWPLPFLKELCCNFTPHSVPVFLWYSFFTVIFFVSWYLAHSKQHAVDKVFKDLGKGIITILSFQLWERKLFGVRHIATSTSRATIHRSSTINTALDQLYARNCSYPAHRLLRVDPAHRPSATLLPQII
jgi:hypothetical protein